MHLLGNPTVIISRSASNPCTVTCDKIKPPIRSYGLHDLVMLIRFPSETRVVSVLGTLHNGSVDQPAS